MARTTAALEASVEIVDAIDGHTMADIPELSVHQPYLGRALTRGEVGCLESHLMVLHRIVRDKTPLACVLEDDIRFSDDCPEVLQTLTRRLAAGDREPWDVLLLGHHSTRRSPQAGVVTSWWSSPLTARRRIARVTEFPMGAYAYVVTRRGAEQLLELARPLRMPMDWVTGYSPVAGARLFAVTPPCVTPEADSAGPSTIAGRPPVGPVPATRGLRTVAGRWALRARRLGLWPTSYVRRL
jgi:glycosyl transferase family 25